MLGVAYKRDIDDVRESPALDVMAAASERAARDLSRSLCAQHRRAQWPGGVDMSSVPLTAESLAAADCVVILTDHRVFDFAEILKHSRLIVDTRNAIKQALARLQTRGADEELVSRVGDSFTYSGRGIPPGGVAPPSNTPGILGRRALPAGRRAPEYLSTNL